MSATLDGARVASLLDGARVVESQGRAFPVETRWTPREPDVRIEEAMAEAILKALRSEPGSVLAFLPGQRETVWERNCVAIGLSSGTSCEVFAAVTRRLPRRGWEPVPT